MMADIKLIRDNCHLFCKTRYPKLPEVADQLVVDTQKLLDK